MRRRTPAKIGGHCKCINKTMCANYGILLVSIAVMVSLESYQPRPVADCVLCVNSSPAYLVATMWVTALQSRMLTCTYYCPATALILGWVPTGKCASQVVDAQLGLLGLVNLDSRGCVVICVHMISLR